MITVEALVGRNIEGNFELWPSEEVARRENHQFPNYGKGPRIHGATEQSSMLKSKALVRTVRYDA